MVWYHGFSHAEIAAATGLSTSEIAAALRKFHILPDNRPPRLPEDPLLVLPYPGGRHPRIGFRDAALNPRRETKISIFTPWDPQSYVVVDVPEAIWSNLGLIYLAHTHIETLWTKQGIVLPHLEWNRREDGTLDVERRLPNGIAFGTKITPGKEGVHMEMWLTNGTPEPLTDLRVQVCVLLKGAVGFAQQTNDNKLLLSPYAACHSEDKQHWIITTWEPIHRVWANPDCPCFHADPQFPDCAPGETQWVHGWLSFYEGVDIPNAFQRIQPVKPRV
jgi:hypothetical protein